MSQPSWGIVSTIKAPTETVLKFVSYHLDQGASDVTVFLDDANLETARALQSHPRAQAILTDDAYWQDWLGRRPPKHQLRQVRNATRHYRKNQKLDWIAHIDVDEFLCTDGNIADELSKCPPEASEFRIAPCESLCLDDQTDIEPDVTYCKTLTGKGDAGRRLEQRLYPQFGGVLKSGFVSHVVGKVFVRSGLKNAKIAIHRAFENKDQRVQEYQCSSIELCHKHIESWEKWLSIMQFRLERGSYRAELETNLSPASGRIQRHQLFSSLTEDGTTDLRAFFEEVCLATPRLRGLLAEEGCLREYRLDLDAKLAKHFPDYA